MTTTAAKALPTEAVLTIDGRPQRGPWGPIRWPWTFVRHAVPR
ncbi:hypothetical protein [Mycobacterium servetii]|uniref:Uncharacterized protein n=1 Tax=Mycobacterium servetii TaxID=3237418 RepID=A0ABV4C2W2_9MYCO